VIRVIEGEWVYPIPTPPELCLYKRRDMRPDGSYKEFAYVGPADEVQTLANRCIDVNMDKVDDLLRKGLSFEDALKELDA
jgi:hypothetical protein